MKQKNRKYELFDTIKELMDNKPNPHCWWLRDDENDPMGNELPYLFDGVKVAQIRGLNMRNKTFWITPQFDSYVSSYTDKIYHNYLGKDERVSVKDIDETMLENFVEFLKNQKS